MSTALGTLAATEQPIRYGWSPQRGAYTERRFRGSFANIRNLFQQYMGAGWTVDVTQQPGDIYELVAKVGDDDVPASGMTGNDVTTQWELLPNEVEKDMLCSSIGYIEALTSDQIAFIKKLMNGKVDETDISGAVGYVPAWDIDANFQQIVLLVVSGVKSARIFAPVLKKTQIIGPRYNVTNAYSNLNCVISTTKLLQQEYIPRRVANIISALNTSGYGTRADGLETYFGWLKYHPTLTVSVGDKEQLSQEWHWGEWSVALYTTVT